MGSDTVTGTVTALSTLAWITTRRRSGAVAAAVWFKGEEVVGEVEEEKGEVVRRRGKWTTPRISHPLWCGDSAVLGTVKPPRRTDRRAASGLRWSGRWPWRALRLRGFRSWPSRSPSAPSLSGQHITFHGTL